MNSVGQSIIKETLPELLRTLDDSLENRELKSVLKEYVKHGLKTPFYRSAFYPFSRDDEKVIDGLLDLINELIKDKMLSFDAIDHIQEKLEVLKKSHNK